MRKLAVVAVTAGLLLVGCGGSSGNSGTDAAPPPPYTVAPHVPVSADGRICDAFGADLPRVRRAIAHDQRAALLRYDGKMGHWSYVAYSRAHDAVLANDLGDAATATGLADSPGGARFARKAARDLHKAALYCQDNITDAPVG